MTSSTCSLISLAPALLLISCTSGSLAAEEGDIPPQNRAFELVLSCAEAKLSGAALNDALLLFKLADEMPLHETPNYDALIGIAEAHCRLGDKSTGLATLKDYNCMLDVEAGDLPCYVGQPEGGAPGRKNTELTKECFERMCSEIYLGYYNDPSQETLEAIAVARARVSQVRGLCVD